MEIPRRYQHRAWLPEMEISEWLEGERFALKPVDNSGIFKNIQFKENPCQF